MISLPSNFVTIEWLIPLFNEELSHLQKSWDRLAQETSVDAWPDFADMTARYHELSGALQMAELPAFLPLTQNLELLSQQLISDREIRNAAHSSGAFANALLQGELNHYAITGDIRHQFLVQCNQKVVRLLPAAISTASAQMDAQASPNILFATQWPIPEILSRPLMAAQYSLLLKAWRQSVRQLLLVNSNEAQYLAPLQKITHYLWQASSSQVLQAIWYLSKIWLDNLGDNEHPTPSQYAGLLAQLDQVLQVLSQLSAEVDSALIDSQMLNEVLQGLTIEGVVAQVCIHLSALTHNNSAAKVVLSAINTDTESAQRFLPRILSKLEAAVFEPQQPLAIVPTLSDIRRLLHQRGWSLYERDIDHIITDIKRLPHAADGSGQLQQQIEQQLQAFTNTILNAHETIVNKIGQTRTFAPSLEAAESDSAHAPYHSQPDTVRQLRIAVEGIKSDFNSYLQQGQTACLPSADKFAAIQQDFIDIQLHEVADVSAQIAKLFAQLKAAELTKLHWPLVNAIAESLASLELFLDYLAQQVFDQNLLGQLQAHIEVANSLLNEIIADPDASDIDTAALFSSELTAADNVTRYDDSGEIVAVNSEQQASSIEIVPAAQATASLVEGNLAEEVATETVGAEALITSAPSASEYSEALIAARATLKDDNFDMDEEIREIFVEEAEEVLEQLDQYLPQWADAPQDFTPLAEIRRGFHTLKGSGRMVGAFNAGEMAWAVEDMLNRVLDKTVPVTDELISFIRDTKDLIPTLVDDFANLRKPSIDPAITVLKAKNILAGQPINQGLVGEGQPEVKMLSSTEANNDSASSLEHSVTTAADLTVTDALEDSGDSHDIDSDSSLASEQLTDIDIDSDSDSDSDSDIANNIATDPMLAEFPEVLAPFMTLALPNDTKDTDPDIKEIFIEEADEVLATIMPKFAQYQTELAHADNSGKNNGKLSAEAEEALLEVRRGFHTLKGSGRMVGANHSAELAWAVEDMLNRILEHTLAPTADMLALVADVISAYPAFLSIYESGTNDYPEEVALWAACANAYSKGLGKQFSYAVAKKQNAATIEQVDNQDAAPETDSKIDALQADSLAVFTRINEQLVAAPVVLQPKNEEEKAFFEVFMEEAQERLETIRNFVKTHHSASEVMVDDEIVRAFHTLKGASGTQSLTTISKISSAIEHSLEQLQQHDAAMRPQHLQALEQAVELIESRLTTYQSNHLQGIADRTQDDNEQDPLDAQVNSTDLQSIQDILGESDSQSGADEISVAQLIQDDIDDLLDAEWELESHLSEQNVSHISAYALTMTEQINRLLASTISLSKFQKLLTALFAVYERLTTDPELAWQDEVVNGLLAGHGELTGLFDALAGSISLKLNETVVDELIHIAQLSASPSLSQQTVASESALAEIKSQRIEDEMIANLSVKSQAMAVSELELEPINTDAELLEIFLEEAQELDADINNIFTTWVEAPNNMEALKALQRHLHTIKGGARMAGIKSLGDLTHEAETVYEYFVGGKLTPSQGWVNVMQGIQDTMSAQIDYLVQHQQSFYATDLVEALQSFISMGTLPEDAKVSLPVFRTVAAEATASEVELVTGLDEHGEDELTGDQPEHNYLEMVAQSWPEEQPDPDILAVFLAEARELDSSIREHMQSFISNTSDVVALQSLQGNLHRLKGGARMVSANGMADLAHQMEAVFEALASRRRPATKLVIQLLIDCQDWLTDAIFVISHHINPPAPAKMTAALESFNENPDSLQEVVPASLQSQMAAIAEHEAMLKAASKQRDISKMPLMTGGFEQGQTASDNTNEMIRIPSGLIERMINLSGESAINRARIDMGMSSLTNSIEEMGITVQRLSDQLRRMDIELEVQILSQIDEEEILDNADFDPLEMDQYSALNQLSKSLSESASDLVDIKTTLLEKTRDSEALLLQLSRTQAELQNGLMDSRMVPFSRLLPRLQRILRQTASELNKVVELDVINADDEIDRTILDRITSPLEHMLRNAVDHGVEMPDQRVAAGKPRAGQIKLEVMREGSEIVIHLTDDGNGIDIEAVRKKAIEQGLIDADNTSLTDREVMQYIFNAGLTTTKKVTQISGRGVGMDVVRSEIRQLGGVVAVDSVEGGGSRFTMRVPLTVAVSDALVVRAADRYYAIPLVQIERVVRVSPEELHAYYQSEDSTLMIENKDYRVRYLNEILSGHTFNEMLMTSNSSLPVIIIKSQTGQSIAMQVDEIAGSRIEVVVKPLGRQMAQLPGISAATIMGDGSVMLILDMVALMRTAQAKPQVLQQPIVDSEIQAVAVDTQTTVLVVDDSVTVRKVTSRFLERQGMRAVVAKDGIDALEILQDLTPDIILLDIEMPRMDGFEVATQVRHQRRLKDIPIIMITSRTGEKHRERAMEIGVNDYMGKPFQEDELLDRIDELLGERDLAANGSSSLKQGSAATQTGGHHDG